MVKESATRKSETPRPEIRLVARKIAKHSPPKTSCCVSVNCVIAIDQSVKRPMMPRAAPAVRWRIGLRSQIRTRLLARAPKWLRA
jgi:hypothetical protein